jgi:hypothetical protein
MTKTARLHEKAPKTCRECQRWGEIRDKVRIHELLEQAIQQFEVKIKRRDYEPTVAEYVKLLQLDREIGHEDEPKEIKVTWVGPTVTSDSGR